MNFMIRYILLIFLMQVAQVEDKVELIMHGGYMIIYHIIINIFKMRDMVDLVQQIIALWQGSYHQRVKIPIILGIAPH